MFGDGKVTGAHDGRYNVLLLGGDSGAGRWGLRPDSMTVASIDAETGRTVLISLPRNMQNFPFAKGSVMHEQFPDGFDCGDCLNGVSTWAGDNTELFRDSDNPGVDATISAIEGITGLKINYWAMVNLEGFQDLVDAVGGVTLNVRQPHPGRRPRRRRHRLHRARVRKLDRLRHPVVRPGPRRLRRLLADGAPEVRDERDAPPDQPADRAQNFEKIAKASSAMISTNIPASEVDRFIALALKARDQKISTLSLVPPMIDTDEPDIKLIQRKVAEAIDTRRGHRPKAPERRATPRSRARPKNRAPSPVARSAP